MKEWIKRIGVGFAVLLAFLGTGLIAGVASGYITWGGTIDYESSTEIIERLSNSGLITHIEELEKLLLNEGKDSRETIIELEGTISSLEDTIEENKSDIDSKEKKIENLKASVSYKEKTIEELENTANELNGYILEDMKTINRLESELIKLNKELDANKDALEIYKSSLEEAQVVISNQEKTIDDKTKELNQAEEDMEDINNKLNKLENKVNDYLESNKNLPVWIKGGNFTKGTIVEHNNRKWQALHGGSRDIEPKESNEWDWQDLGPVLE